MGDDGVLATGRFLRLVCRDGWEYVERINGNPPVGIVAVTPQGSILLVEQFRRPLGRTCIELPAGLVGDLTGQENEAVKVAAARELEEETGYRPASVELLTEGPSSAGLTSETIRLVRATDLMKVSAGGGDESEDIIVHEVPLAEVAAWLDERRQAGVPIDAKVYAGLWFAGVRR